MSVPAVDSLEIEVGCRDKSTSQAAGISHRRKNFLKDMTSQSRMDEYSMYSMLKTAKDLIPTRRSLLSRLKNWEDQESWQDFFDTYWKLLYGVANRSGLTDDESEEVVQETIIRVAKQMPNFKYDPAVGSFKNWLLHTTGWCIASQFRKRVKDNETRVFHPKNALRTARIDQVPDPAGFDLEGIWDSEWQKHILDAAIARVKPQVNAKHYQIFDLYVIKKWPVNKVARTFGISRARVYLIKHRVAGLIKKEIKRLEAEMI
jgi:RNA polymerase sigma-70 factor (ECF subfamily)